MASGQSFRGRVGGVEGWKTPGQRSRRWEYLPLEHGRTARRSRGTRDRGRATRTAAAVCQSAVSLSHLTGTSPENTNANSSWLWLAFGLSLFFLASLIIGRIVGQRKIGQQK
jgi:hypothetical protein